MLKKYIINNLCLSDFLYMMILFNLKDIKNHLKTNSYLMIRFVQTHYLDVQYNLYNELILVNIILKF